MQSGTRTNRRRAVPWALVTTITLLGTSGCALLPSDPEPPPVGARMEGDTLVIKFPMCPKDEIQRVEVYDWDDDADDTPRVVWWASDPTSATVREHGVFPLWTGKGFTHHAPRPQASAIPSNIGVDYTSPTGPGLDAVFTVHEIKTATLKPDEYWTWDGPLTAAQIDDRFGCGED
ncbi:hypothetical protein ACWD25_40715 [Streptomyces sp. NPDC002920]